MSIPGGDSQSYKALEALAWVCGLTKKHHIEAHWFHVLYSTLLGKRGRRSSHGHVTLASCLGSLSKELGLEHAESKEHALLTATGQ